MTETGPAWFDNALDRTVSPVDLRWLNEAHGPAGSHGALVVDGERLVFADGTPARFWGTNLAANALFRASDELIAQQTRRLSSLGYNLVRLHHHDSAWCSNVFVEGADDTRQLDPKALDRLDKWIAALAAEGIYVWIDLHTGREFRPGDDIPGQEELARLPRPNHGLGVSYINPRIQELLEEFNTQYLTRVNRYTGHTWASDPAVVGVLITNENDVTHHYGREIPAGQGLDAHRKMLRESGLAIATELGLRPADARALRGSEAGRVLLAELQHRFDVRAREHLRGLGVTAPVATTNFWGFEGLRSLTPLLFGDVIDVHSYGKAGALSTDPNTQPHWLHHIATAQVAGKPLTVSEWSVPRDEEDRHTATLWVAAIAALQGWDALLGYCYGYIPLEYPSPPRTRWEQRIDPALLALAPTAALMFRRGDVSQARETIALAPTAESFWGGSDPSPKSAVALRTASERSRTVVIPPPHPKLAWSESVEPPPGAIVVEDLDRNLLAAESNRVTSDTGEIERNWEDGTLTIVTPRVQAASGAIGGRTITLPDLEIQSTTASATVSAIALDGAPLSESKDILITAVARAETLDDGTSRSEPVTGTVRLRSEATDTWQSFALYEPGRTHWRRVVR